MQNDELITLRIDKGGNIVDANGVSVGVVYEGTELRSVTTALSVKKIQKLVDSGLTVNEIIQLQQTGVVR